VKSDINNVSMMSIAKQTKLYVERLKSIAESCGSWVFDYQQLVQTGKDMNL